jgi:hypothetical protein
MKRKVVLVILTVLFFLVVAMPAAATGWTVVMWSGDPAELADGWQVCDGTNGAPDLTDRFLVGAGGEYILGDVGGAVTTTLAHQHQVASHTHSIASADLSHTHTVPAHTHTITSADISHTHTVPAHTHTISSVNLAHSHTVYQHRHEISAEDLAHTHYIAYYWEAANYNAIYPLGFRAAQGDILYTYLAGGASGGVNIALRYTTSALTTHSHGGYTAYASATATDQQLGAHDHGAATGSWNGTSGAMSANSTHNHGGATGSWDGTSGAMSANSTHTHGGGVTGAMSANSTHNHGGSTGSWNGTSGAMSANSTHNHGGSTGSWDGTSGAMSANSTHNHTGSTGSVSPMTDYQLSMVDLRPPYYAVYYICKAGVITYTPSVTASMLITDPLTTNYYTTTEGIVYSKVRTVTTEGEVTNYLLGGMVVLSLLQLMGWAVLEGKRRWS